MGRSLLRRMMPAAMTAALAVTACSDAGDSRRIITEACIRDGGGQDACACLGRESAARLDADALDAIVFGALGAPAEADKVIAEMDEAAQVRFRAGVEAVMLACPSLPAAVTPAPAS